ncbi:hypothetical protein [Sinorhizobium fredii]|uniref:hypothetical protein n=1 Tax=Rhizobium fredii TaxID=380 RepID=UPI003393A53C
MTLTNKPNRHERRKVSAKFNSSEKTTAAFTEADAAQFVDLVAHAHDLAEALLDEVSAAATKTPDVKYKKPLLLLTPKVLAFGEGETLAAAFAASAKPTDKVFHCFDLSKHVAGETTAEVAVRFLRKKIEMLTALTVVATSILAREAGYANEEIVLLGADQIEEVFEILGIPRKPGR